MANQVSTTFPDSTYTSANKPSVETLKTDIAAIETAHNASDTAGVKKTDTDVSANDWVLDEDAMGSDSDQKLPTQQSVKAYTDTHIADTTTHGATGDIVGTTDTQTLSAKTLTKPTINGSTPGNTAYTPAGAATATLDCSDANRHVITMPAGNITIALSNIATGQAIVVEIIQDGTGSRTVTWFSTIKWAGGSAPTLTTTASKKDSFGFICTGSGTYDGFIIGQNI